MNRSRPYDRRATVDKIVSREFEDTGKCWETHTWSPGARQSKAMVCGLFAQRHIMMLLAMSERLLNKLGSYRMSATIKNPTTGIARKTMIL
jgi:hypothetical protein